MPLRTPDEIFNIEQPSPGLSLDVASKTDADRNAEALTYSQKIGLPLETVDRNLEEIKRQDRLNQNKLSDNYPATSQYLSDHQNAMVSHDDVSNLKQMEDVLKETDEGSFVTRRAMDLVRSGLRLVQGANVVSADQYAKNLEMMERVNREGITDARTLGRFMESTGRYIAPSEKMTDYVNADEETRKRMFQAEFDNMMEDAGDVGKYAESVQQVPKSEARKRFDKAVGFRNALNAFLDSPLEVATGLTTESLAQYAPAVPFLFMGGGPAAVAAGLTSFSGEYANDMLGSMQEAGIDPRDPEQVAAAFRDPEKMAEWRDHATTRGVTIAAFDSISAGIGGALIRRASTTPGRVGAAATEALVLQPGLGGAGEATASVMVGEEIRGEAVLAEMLGELAPGTVETFAGAYRHGYVEPIEKAAVKKIEAENKSAVEQVAIDQIVKFSQESKTNGRMQDRYESFLKAAGNQKEVIITPEGVNAAIEAGVALPVEKFGVDFAKNQELMDVIRPHLKLTEDTLTPSQMRERTPTSLDELVKRAEEDTQEFDKATEIYEQVSEQLTATGRMRREDALANAILIPSRVVTEAQRSGRTVEEVWEDLGVKKVEIVGPKTPVTPDAETILNQQPDLEVTLPVENLATGEVTQQTFNAFEVMQETDSKLDAYRKLLECMQ